jgi:ABC-type molybdenum transport system ATPase subunit/photorepair protein PhrA
MFESRGYRRFVSLIERIEGHGSRRQLATLTFRRPGGGVAGVVTVDRGLVRFGARCEGCDPVDEPLQRDSPQLADALMRALQHGTPAAARPVLEPPLTAPQYAALCGLTARTLRRIAEAYDPGAPADCRGGAEPPGYVLDAAFAPSELMLAAGRCGGINRHDPSVRLYGSPPGRAEERWLFERQPGEPGVPWPIMTTRLNGKGLSAIAACGKLVQLLSASSLARDGGASLRSPQVAILRFEQQLCVLHSTARYITLLFYREGHAKRVLSAFEDLAAQARAETPAIRITLPEVPRAPEGNDGAEAMPADPAVHGDLPGPPASTEEEPAALPQIPEEEAPAAGPVLWEERDPQRAAVLSLRGFRVHLGARCVLRDLSLDIAPVGTYLLVAPEGGAKRLLVRALCGPRPGDMRCSGSARYLGGQLLRGSGPSTPRSGAALVMMSACDYLISNLPDRELLLRPAQRLKARRLIDQARFPGLAERFDVPLLQLDAKERRALEIVRAAATRPALLVLDEPLAGVDPAERPPLLELLRMQSRERAVLMLAQDADPLLPLDPRTGWLREEDPTARSKAAGPDVDWQERAADALPGAEQG